MGSGRSATWSPFAVACKGMSCEAKANSKIRSVSSVGRRVHIVWNTLALISDQALVCNRSTRSRELEWKQALS